MADYIVNVGVKDNASQSLNTIKQSFNNLGQASSELDKIRQRFEKITSSSMPARRELKQLQELMTNMNLKGLSNTDVFTEIALKAGKIRDAMADAKTATNAYANDVMNLQAASQAISGITAAASMATSAMALLGTENEDLARVLVKVQAAQGMVNAATTIANILNKDSALMLKLKQLFMTSNTASTIANTAAEGANSAAQGVNTAATVANSAATVANTTATVAATGAQTAFNAAVLANPYVLAAAAIAALVAGVVLYANSLDDATDSQIAMNTAVEAFNEVVDTHMNKAAEQIQLYDKLKQQYDSSGKKVDDFAKKLIANTAVQRKLGIVVKTVDDVHRVFSNNTKTYAAAANARATAMAVEAAKATLLGKTLAQLTHIYAKLRAGQEVNWRDIQAIYESVGYSAEQAAKKMKEAGYVQFHDSSFFGGYADAFGGDLQKSIEQIMDGPAFKELSKIGERAAKSFGNTNSINFDNLLDNNFDALSDSAEKTSKASGKTAKSSGQTSKNVKETKDEVKKVLTTLEGCDAIIDEANKKIRALDKNSKTYNEDLEKLKNTILAASVAKLSLIDQSTIAGLTAARKVAQDIINLQPKDSPEKVQWQTYKTNIDKKIYDFISEGELNGSTSELREMLRVLEQIMNELPEGSDEIEKWGKEWNRVNTKLQQSERYIDDLKKGIEEGSVKKIQDQIKDIQEELNNKNLTAEVRLKLNQDLTKLQQEIDEKTKGQITITAVPQVSYINKGSVDDKRASYNNAQQRANQIKQDVELNIIPRKEGLKQINELNAQLKSLGLEPIHIHFESNLDRIFDGVQDGIQTISDITSSIDGVINAFDSLGESINEGADAWTIFKNSVAATQEVLQAITTVMQVVNMISGLLGASKVAGAAADTEAAGAATAEAAAETASIAPKVAATAANKALETSVLDLAAAQIFAAHAAIPFAGTGIAAGMVTSMMTAMAAQHAASLALQSFSNGGIVQGNSRIGDNLLVRVNSHEMILNDRQQSNLFKAIDSNRLGGGNTVLGGEVRIKGSDLYIALKNFGKQQNLHGKNIGIY